VPLPRQQQFGHVRTSLQQYHPDGFRQRQEPSAARVDASYGMRSLMP
jgi:hypothetical protein